ncbi:hypothetical protein DL764_008541 [Monosporascus ibericus]|uniref:START domain-containing protein n=1 Tax=Monosporascus ibericus TaxID=155417 RepID=A0A4Q4SXA7_9PEZI|nr:hypothetical protein DL764_008541 [Monosporascus ibericus]
MTSFLYSTKTAKKEYYHIPDALNLQDVLVILRDHSTLSNVFWPRSTMEIPEEKCTGPSTTEFRIGSSAARSRAIMTTKADGIVYEEDMPLGLKVTVVYRVANCPPGTWSNDSDASSDRLLSLSESRLCLEEERSVVGPRPLLILTNLKEGPIVKTRNLMWVLDEFARNGKDLVSALGSLQLSTADPNDADELEKPKAD